VRSSLVARSYAETLLALAQRHEGVDEFARGIAEVADLLDDEPRIREFLDTPRVDAEAKKHALRASFRGRIPEMLLRFLLVVVEKRRQGVLREIAAAYGELVDELYGQVRARITLPNAPDPRLRQEVIAALERRLGKRVIPTWETDPGMIGGVVVRVGDQILDGSMRRRIASLKQQLLRAELGGAPAAA
jgi:F-type H+-transporting ATPase subunit delta